MVAVNGTHPSTLAPLQDYRFQVKAESGWDKFLDVLKEIVSFGQWNTRLGNDVLPEAVNAALTNEAARLVTPELVAQYRAMRRDSGSETTSIMTRQLSARIKAASPGVNDAQIGNATATLVRALEARLVSEPGTAVPAPSEGFDALTREFETSMAPRAVGRAQGEAFNQALSILQRVTTEDRSDEGMRTGEAVAGLFLLFITWGDVINRDKAAAPGVLTSEEVAQLRARVQWLPESDRHLVGTMLGQMIARDQVAFDKPEAKAAAQALATEASGSATATEQSAGQLLASLAAFDYITANLKKHSQSIPRLNETQEETMRARVATQLAAELAAAPASVQRLARTYLQQRLLAVPADVTSPAIARLRTLAL